MTAAPAVARITRVAPAQATVSRSTSAERSRSSTAVLSRSAATNGSSRASAPADARFSSLLQLSTLTVSSPSDPAEREAESTADAVVSMGAPAARPAATALAVAPRIVAPAILRKADGARAVPSAIGGEIAAQAGSGSPLSPPLRAFMEPRFGASFADVRVHTGPGAARLSARLGAQAFTVGNQVFFGEGQFRPDAPEGRRLIAHELTHTIQQGSVAQRGAPVQRSVAPSVTQRTGPQVQRLGISDALNYFADAANAIPGYRMFTIILGVNPINMGRVERSAANILRALVEFLPGGGLITQALDNHGVFDRVGSWIEQQISSLGMTGSVIRDAINRFLDSLSWRDIFNLSGVWGRARRIFTEPIDRILSFGRGLVTGILRFIKEAILRPLARLAEGTRGYDLLKAVLGEDPVTGDAVPRHAETLIGGFMRLIGQEEIWQNIQRANAIPRAWAWFQNALGGLVGLVRQIPSRFVQAFQSLEIMDIVLVPRAFARIAAVFAGFIGDFLSWAGGTIWSLLEIIFEVVAPSVMVYLRRAASTFRTILRNPIGFVGNLVRAGAMGLRQFARNFLTHLRGALVGWLTGAMSGANIYIPQGFNLREILKFVLSVLGLTWQNIRQKLVRAVGETTVRVLETTFDIVVVLVREGPAAAWQKILEALTNLREMVIEQVMTFVRDRVVTAAITRLASMLSPVGAFIQAIIGIYNTVMFFVERLRQIAQVAASFIDSITAIANGVLQAAADRVERTMAGLLTLVISFLARIAGLGRVSDAVTNVINRVRQPIDRGMDRVVDWIVAQARRLGRGVAGAARGAAQRVLGWLGLRRPIRTVGGASHVMFFRPQGAGSQLAIRSEEMSLEGFLANLRTKYARDPAKLARVSAAEVLVQDIRRMTAPSAAPAAANASVDTAVQGKIDALAPVLQEIGDGVSTDGATAAYRGLHWWVDATQSDADAATDPQFLASLARQELGARQLSAAVTAVLSRGLTSDVDEAIRIVNEKMASIRDGRTHLETSGPPDERRVVAYFDRFHYLVGRYVTKLQAVRTRFAASTRILELDAEILGLRTELSTLSRDSREYHLSRRRLQDAETERRRARTGLPTVYQDLAPQVTASPFVATSLSARKAAEYAIGSLFTPQGKRQRTVGVVGRMLVFVASVAQLVRDGTYSIDQLATAGRIKIRAGFSENELMFTGSIPGEYLKATLEVQAGQSENTVASAATGRAGAEAARFGGLK